MRQGFCITKQNNMISLPFSASRLISTQLLNFTNLRFPPIPKTSFKPSQRPKFTTNSTNNEELSAKTAAANADPNAPTIFDKIISKQIPSSIVYEDDEVLAFRDINPQAPVHVLVIPKFRDGLTQLSKAEERHKEVLGQLLYAARIVAEREGLEKGYRVVVNDGVEGCQSVYHLHLHVLGGRQMKWPPG